MAIVHKDVFKILGFASSGTDEAIIQEFMKGCLESLIQLKAYGASITKTERLSGPGKGILSVLSDGYRGI
jgi:hypothetical protein